MELLENIWGKRRIPCSSGLHSVAVITLLPKETWGRKSLFSHSSPRSYSIPGVREELEAGTGCRDHRRRLLPNLLALWLLLKSVFYAAWPTWLELELPIVHWALRYQLTIAFKRMPYRHTHRSIWSAPDSNSSVEIPLLKHVKVDDWS